MTVISVYDTLEDLLKRAVFAVEATSFEQLCIYQKYAKDLSWTSRAASFGVTLGHIKKRPVVISVSFCVLEDQVVMFWHATSQLVDYQLVDAWLAQHFSKETPGGRRPQCDAQNFHLCVQALGDYRMRAAPCTEPEALAA